MIVLLPGRSRSWFCTISCPLSFATVISIVGSFFVFPLTWLHLILLPWHYVIAISNMALRCMHTTSLAYYMKKVCVMVNHNCLSIEGSLFMLILFSLNCNFVLIGSCFNGSWVSCFQILWISWYPLFVDTYIWTKFPLFTILSYHNGKSPYYLYVPVNLKTWIKHYAYVNIGTVAD